MSEVIQRLELGHQGKRPGWICVDFRSKPNAEPDYVLNMEEAKLPFPDNTFDLVRAFHVLEHIRNLLPLMDEVWRITKPTGRFEIEVPVFPSSDAFIDPTHVRYFTQHTFNYWIQGIGFTDLYELKPWKYLEKQCPNHLQVVLQPVKS